MPCENAKDLEQIPSFILEKINIIMVSNYKEVYDSLFKKNK